MWLLRTVDVRYYTATTLFEWVTTTFALQLEVSWWSGTRLCYDPFMGSWVSNNLHKFSVNYLRTIKIEILNIYGRLPHIMEETRGTTLLPSPIPFIFGGRAHDIFAYKIRQRVVTLTNVGVTFLTINQNTVCQNAWSKDIEGPTAENNRETGEKTGSSLLVPYMLVRNFPNSLSKTQMSY